MQNFKTENGKYFINSKEVDEKVYISMLEEALDQSKKQNETISKLMANTNNTNRKQEDDCEEEFCEDCQGILDLINDLCEMPPEEALDVFREIVGQHRQEAFIEGMIEAYNNLGSIAFKVASKLENQLDDMVGMG